MFATPYSQFIIQNINNSWAPYNFQYCPNIRTPFVGFDKGGGVAIFNLACIRMQYSRLAWLNHCNRPVVSCPNTCVSESISGTDTLYKSSPPSISTCQYDIQDHIERNPAIVRKREDKRMKWVSFLFSAIWRAPASIAAPCQRASLTHRINHNTPGIPGCPYSPPVPQIILRPFGITPLSHLQGGR